MAVERAAAHAFVPDVERPELSAADHHHLTRVLRMAPGTAFTVSDGRGRWRLCRLAPAEGDLEAVGDVHVEVPVTPPVTVAFALTKGERPEWTVQKLTELGVDSIVPIAAERSVVRVDPHRTARQLERWRRVAREAAAQSRRAWLPEVEEVRHFAAVASRPGACLAEPGGAPPSLRRPVVLVGPEGGWSEAEQAAASGLPRVGLGALVVRAETAAMLAGGLLCALRSSVVCPSEQAG